MALFVAPNAGRDSDLTLTDKLNFEAHRQCQRGLRAVVNNRA